jgi:hypothetical protein
VIELIVFGLVIVFVGFEIGTLMFYILSESLGAV